VNARARNEAKKRTLLADVERALLEALAESAEMHKVLYRLQRAGWALELHLDCHRANEPEDAEAVSKPRRPRRAATERSATPEPAFVIDSGDLRFLRSIGIDPTRKRRRRTTG
jgi:hypothetical protein